MKGGIPIDRLRREHATHMHRRRQHLTYRIGARIANNNSTVWTLNNRLLSTGHYVFVGIAKETHHNTLTVLNVTPFRWEQSLQLRLTQVATVHRLGLSNLI